MQDPQTSVLTLSWQQNAYIFMLYNNDSQPKVYVLLGLRENNIGNGENKKNLRNDKVIYINLLYIVVIRLSLMKRSMLVFSSLVEGVEAGHVYEKKGYFEI